MSKMTCGEECQSSARIFSAFNDIPNYFNCAMGIAVAKGCYGVAVIRLKTGEFSAPCAFALTSPQNSVAPAQETLILFMTERSIVSLVKNDKIILGQTHSFAPGPFQSLPVEPGVDFYLWIRFNNGFTPENIIAQNMVGWTLLEDRVRHKEWHGETVTWYDVLTNKISIDRSSVGNALYLVINLSASKNNQILTGTRNYVEINKLSSPQSQFNQAYVSAQQQGQSNTQYVNQYQNNPSNLVTGNFSQFSNNTPSYNPTNIQQSQFTSNAPNQFINNNSNQFANNNPAQFTNPNINSNQFTNTNTNQYNANQFNPNPPLNNFNTNNSQLINTSSFQTIPVNNSGNDWMKNVASGAAPYSQQIPSNAYPQQLQTNSYPQPNMANQFTPNSIQPMQNMMNLNPQNSMQQNNMQQNNMQQQNTMQQNIQPQQMNQNQFTQPQLYPGMMPYQNQNQNQYR